MCGITGILNKNQNVDINKLRMMNNVISHRGPDDDGLFIRDNIGLGHRRLSIIDLNTGNQPMYNNDETLVIVFNGEIYNYKIIKDQLITDHNITFTTHSDTEVILKGYEVWGNEIVNYIEGMFAFSIFDKKKNTIIIARDRFGEKPIYYFKNDKQVVWASELKSIIINFPELKKISLPALNLFLTLTYIPAPYTIYENIYKLKPGHYIEIDTQSLQIKETSYWNIDLTKPINLTDYSKAKRELKSLFFETVKKRMVSDVPLGVFLSGGVDSSIVAAIMSKISDTPIKTFSISYTNPRYDESARARAVANHIRSEHHEYTLNHKEILYELDKLILNFDEPYADSSCIPTYFVSKKTVNHVKVALTGDGGDEVFGGYNKYLIHSYGKIYEYLIPSFLNKLFLKVIEYKSFNNSDTKGLLSKIKKVLINTGNGTIKNHLNIISLGFNFTELQKLLSPNISQNVYNLILDNIPLQDKKSDKISPLKLARYIDIHTSLEGDMLVKVDRSSMLCSLECRAPFLDHKLMELSFCMPDNFLIKGNNKKRILKDTFSYLLPKDFFNSPKFGFEVPISEWFRNELKDDLISTLSESNIKKHNYFNFPHIEKLIYQHINQNNDQSSKLWTLFCFQKWYNHNFN